MARKYDVKGTQTYLICAVLCFLFGVWHLYDGWFPRPAVLQKHPKEIVLEAPRAGIVEEVYFEVGDEVTYVAPILAIKPTVEEGDAESEMGISVKVSMNDELDKESKVKNGIIQELDIKENDTVTAGQEVVKLSSTRDSYYLYNKTTAVIFLIAAAVCAYIHKVAK